MTIAVILLFIIGVAALAPRYGVDSRNLADSRPSNYPALPDNSDAWVTSVPR